MVSQGHGSGNSHWVAVLFPLQGEDVRWVKLAANRLERWFGNAGMDIGALVKGDVDDPDEVLPTIIIYSQVNALTDLTLTRIFGLGLVLALKSGRDGIAVVVDDDLIIL